MQSDILEKVRNLPLTSGVYLMKDASGRVIYAGKAVSLRKRVQSYFRASASDDATRLKNAILATEIRDIEVVFTSSEAEALILEASLIKKFNPKYNVDLKDDKSYPFIEITKEKYPRVFLVRPQRKNPTSDYYGPYVSPRLIREALSFLRKVFPYCLCERRPPKPCLDHHIGLCPAPCAGKISPREYGRNIRGIRLILEGKKDLLYKQLQKDMERLSRAKQFEEAAQVRDRLQAIAALFSGSGDVNDFKETEQLQRSLGLANRPERIEAFDISHIMGQQSVGSMVSFLNGRPDKSNYRRFRIRGVEGIDDFRMIAEVVRRRYQRLKREGLFFPDLVVIDGGKGQLSAACQELERLQVDIPVIALAKKEEEIFQPRRSRPLVLSKGSLSLRLLQRVRDEAHRFAVTYHRNLRGKNVFKKVGGTF